MKTRTMLRILALLSLVGVSAPARAAAAEPLPAVLTRALRAFPPEAQVGILVLDADGRRVFDRQPDKLFLPASTAKLFVAAAVLDLGGTGQLGMRTDIAVTALPDPQGVVNGDLLFLSSGDPLLFTDLLDDYLSVLTGNGIRHIRGSVQIVPQWPQPISHPPGWSWEDLSQPYGAVRGAIVLDRQLVTVVCAPTTPGGTASVALEPAAAAAFFSVDNQSRTVASGARGVIVTRALGTRVISVTGDLAADSSAIRTSVTVPDPEAYFLAVTRRLLEDRGITVGDRPLGGRPIVLGTNYGLSLSALVKRMLKSSDNLIAEQLALFVAGVGYPLPQMRGVHLADASGVSRYNLVSPRALVRLLDGARHEPWFEDFLAGLPVGGVDGTLARRFTEGAGRGRVRAKTGTARGVSTLAGYVLDADGAVAFTFAVLVNNYTKDDAEVRRAIDAFVTRLAEAAGD